ncbi:MAG: NTP transferase domain-containing protein [Candidatus Sabulitectum sp.]|nr:NTP transferase domain-containing protein [Candidatus Sabulitectum sp.]
MKAVIIAAGRGSRLESQHRGMPKTLLKVGDRRIIDSILDGIHDSGIREVVIVTGFQADILKDQLRNTVPASISLEFCFNPEWKLSNGISVLSAEKFITPGDEFILLMSDHIFQSEMLKITVETPIEPDQALLALDFKLNKIPDLNDGMKVRCRRIAKSRFQITGLDKKYEDYQAIDCGMFKLNYGFFQELRNCIELGRDSLSDTCNAYAAENRMIGIDIGESRWIDLDSPELFDLKNLISRITE